jgi:CDP-diacylglycerol--serine O-phosphatidyltransferase
VLKKRFGNGFPMQKIFNERLELRGKDVVTLANAWCGLLAVLSAFQGNSASAALWIVAACAFDFLDGFVAKKSGKHNDFGKELDSLADVISFGVAPAMIWVFYQPVVANIFVQLFFASAGAVRLALFNLQSEKGVFVGLPIPVAALLSLTVFQVKDFAGFETSLLLVALLAFLMVGSFRIKK